jgi:hypothetical protein
MKLSDLKDNKDNFVGLLSLSQKNELIGQQFDEDSFFNPIQDLNDNWIISVEEIEFCTNEAFFWVKDLEIIIYEPKPITPPIL